jgi:hypothetical protein
MLVVQAGQLALLAVKASLALNLSFLFFRILFEHPSTQYIPHELFNLKQVLNLGDSQK